MDAAQSTFISSTFWTERISPAAALNSLEVMEQMESWKIITEKGKNISSRWKLLGEKYDLPLVTWGLPALSGFTITGEESLAYKTYITQEMLKQGMLASNCVYVCTEHSSEVVDRYFEFLDPMFATIKECGDGGEIMQLLESPVCHGSFKRLN